MAAASAQELSVELMTLDVTDDALGSKAVDRVVEAEGRIDVLVDNGGRRALGVLECPSLEPHQVTGSRLTP